LNGSKSKFEFPIHIPKNGKNEIKKTDFLANDLMLSPFKRSNDLIMDNAKKKDKSEAIKT